MSSDSRGDYLIGLMTGTSLDGVDAVLASGSTDAVALEARALAMDQLSKTPEFGPLKTGHRLSLQVFSVEHEMEKGRDR